MGLVHQMRLACAMSLCMTWQLGCRSNHVPNIIPLFGLPLLILTLSSFNLHILLRTKRTYNWPLGIGHLQKSNHSTHVLLFRRTGQISHHSNRLLGMREKSKGNVEKSGQRPWTRQRRRVEDKGRRISVEVLCHTIAFAGHSKHFTYF